MIFNFGLGQGGFGRPRPVNRLLSLVQESPLSKGTKDLDLGRFKFLGQGQVWVIPLPGNPEALKALLLNFDLLQGVLLTQVPELS